MCAKLVHNYTANGSSTTDEYGTQLILNRILGGEVVEGFTVVANGTPNMTVKVNPGSGRIPTGTYPASYGYLISHDTSGGESVTISAAAASARKDYIVAYVDKGVAGSTSPGDVNNTNNVLKFVAVAGTPGGSPNPPTTMQIQTAVGASNPYIVIAEIAVGALVSTITNGNITDKRTMATLAMSLDASTVIKDGTVTAGKMDIPYIGWTPTWTNLSVGNGTRTARYIQTGNNVSADVHLTFGNTTSISGSVSISVPVPAAARYASPNYQIVGSVLLVDEGTAVLRGDVYFNGSNSAVFVARNVVSGSNVTNAAINATTPFTWTTGDKISIRFSYEAA